MQRDNIFYKKESLFGRKNVAESLIIQNAKRVFDNINSDKSEASSSIELKEFLSAYRMLIETYGKPNENDNNQSSTSQEDEMIKWENFGKGIGLSKEQVNHAVDTFYKQDADGSGEIEIDEFITLMS